MAEQTNNTIDYDKICKLVGNLYIEVANVREQAETHYKNVVQNLTTQVSELIKENESLRESSPQLDLVYNSSEDSLQPIESEIAEI